VPRLALCLPDLPFPQPFTGNNRRRGTQRVPRQVNQRGDGKSNKVAGDNVGPHPGNKHLRQQFTAVEQHRLDARRDANAHHFPDNRQVERLEVALQRDTQRRVKTNCQHPDYRHGTNIAGDGEPETGTDKPETRPGKMP
jgi:hypothetical protein